MTVLTKIQTATHTVRFRLLAWLCTQPELTVSQLVELTGLTQPIVSQHLITLKYAGLAASRPRQTFKHYRVTDEGREVTQWLFYRMSPKERKELGL
jgi:DNA-binding transcriptional ArsR family regulator